MNKNPPPDLETGEQKESHWKWSEIFRFVLISIIIVVPIRMFIAQPFLVSGASMEPTFDDGEYLIVDQVTYRFEKPLRGDVVIFRFPKDPSKYYIKRILGLPGETIIIEGQSVTIKNSEYPDGFTLDEPYIVFKRGDQLSVTLGEDEYFVMGDNRLASSDSRSWGPVKEELIVGRPMFRLLPVSHIGILPGVYKDY